MARTAAVGALGSLSALRGGRTLKPVPLMVAEEREG
jgi:hypothetical protein